jgi:hypothetical protein
MMDDLLTQAGTAKDKILGLANALPEDAYAWRPMEGVRSTAELFVHIAADNYFIPVIMGVEAPAETGITMNYSPFVAYEASSSKQLMHDWRRQQPQADGRTGPFSVARHLPSPSRQP